MIDPDEELRRGCTYCCRTLASEDLILLVIYEHLEEDLEGKTW